MSSASAKPTNVTPKSTYFDILDDSCSESESYHSELEHPVRKVNKKQLVELLRARKEELLSKTATEIRTILRVFWKSSSTFSKALAECNLELGTGPGQVLREKQFTTPQTEKSQKEKEVNRTDNSTNITKISELLLSATKKNATSKETNIMQVPENPNDPFPDAVQVSNSIPPDPEYTKYVQRIRLKLHESIRRFSNWDGKRLRFSVDYDDEVLKERDLKKIKTELQQKRFEANLTHRCGTLEDEEDIVPVLKVEYDGEEEEEQTTDGKCIGVCTAGVHGNDDINELYIIPVSHLSQQELQLLREMCNPAALWKDIIWNEKADSEFRKKFFTDKYSHTQFHYIGDDLAGVYICRDD